MNELIKELAGQAWQYANDNSRDGDETHGWLYRDKFAELIVRECATVAYDGPGGILEHFGVEE